MTPEEKHIEEVLVSDDYELKNFPIKKFCLSASGDFDVTSEVLDYYNKYGFILIQGLLPEDELQKLKTVVEQQKAISETTFGRDDNNGRRTKVALWNNVDDGYTGLVVRSEKLAFTWDKLINDGEVYHYHTKVIMKDAGTGAAFNWHQDYGYWYLNSCMAPTMGTTFCAIDKTHRRNGCLKFVPGSHHLGRQDTKLYADQVNVEHERMHHILKRKGFVYCELEPGDAVFFHANLLHRSEQNSSGDRRWAFLVSYNTKNNDPIVKHAHPSYEKLYVVLNSALKGDPTIPSHLKMMTSNAEDKATVVAKAQAARGE